MAAVLVAHDPVAVGSELGAAGGQHGDVVEIVVGKPPGVLRRVEARIHDDNLACVLRRGG